MHTTRAAGLTALLCLAALCGCGQKGPLVLPDAPLKHRNIPRLPKPTPATPAAPGTPGAAAPAPATAPVPATAPAPATAPTLR